jgi:hypothetical protein
MMRKDLPGEIPESSRASCAVVVALAGLSFAGFKSNRQATYVAASGHGGQNQRRGHGGCTVWRKLLLPERVYFIPLRPSPTSLFTGTWGSISPAL